MAFLNFFAFAAFSAFIPQAAALQSPVGSPLEYQVKAAFILHFVNLTEWPAAALGQPADPFRICVAGNGPFGAVLESTIKGESVKGHPLVMERLDPVDRAAHTAAQACLVLFVPASDTAQAVELLRTLGSTPVLTIGEANTFLRDGGVVRFVIDEGHVRFDVNRRTADQHGLTLSSRLLRVARSVQ